MTDALSTIALVAATVTTGLVAGLFYGFSCAVMPGLKRADDRTFVNAMRAINVAILNGWFAIGFGGAPVLTVLAAVLHFGGGSGSGPAVLPWIVAAFVLYAVMLAITFGINIPLNNRIDADGKNPETTDHPAARARFETTWVRWNTVRTLASTASLACLAWALILHGQAAAG